MAAVYTVTAALVVAHVGGKVQHFYAGDVLPVNVDEGSLKNLKSLGYVAKSGDAVADQTDEPSDAWTVKQLQAFAGEHSIDLGDAKNKPDILAAVLAATQA